MFSKAQLRESILQPGHSGFDDGVVSIIFAVNANVVDGATIAAEVEKVMGCEVEKVMGCW